MTPDRTTTEQFIAQYEAENAEALNTVREALPEKEVEGLADAMRTIGSVLFHTATFGLFKREQ